MGIRIDEAALDLAGRPLKADLSLTQAERAMLGLGQENRSERARAEDARRESEAPFRTLIENIPQRVVLKDLGSRHIAVNRAAAEMLDRPVEEIVGKTDHDLFPEDVAARNVLEDREVIESGKVGEFLVEEVLKGEKRHLRKVKVPVRDGSGRITGVLVTLDDFTERVALEEKVRHMQKMEAVGRLAGGVAHDFNNLLTVIGGYTGICLASASLGGALRENLLEIQTAVERATSLTRQLLAFSRRQVMCFSIVDLNAIVRETKKMLQRLLGEDVRVFEMLAPDLGRVKGDPGQIEQVITNLAVNARDAMPEGGRLMIATGNLDLAPEDRSPVPGLAPGCYVRLTVADTGHGMSPEVLARVFEPFFTTKPPGEGTGLGLATVFAIVQQSGGEIRVASEPGKGTTFTVYLPRVEEDAERPEEETETREAAGSETVLIIEDDKALGRLAAKMLRSKGYRVLKASCAAEAFRVFSAHPGPIDLVLSDVVMPDGRGPVLVERLRQVRPGFAALYMSGYADSEFEKASQLRCGDNFIRKPFTAKSLSDHIRNVLDKDRRGKIHGIKDPPPRRRRVPPARKTESDVDRLAPGVVAAAHLLVGPGAEAAGCGLAAAGAGAVETEAPRTAVRRPSPRGGAPGHEGYRRREDPGQGHPLYLQKRVL